MGGPAVHVILLTAGLKARGYSTVLAVGKESPREGNLLDLAAAKGVECLQLGALGREIRPLADARALWQLWRLIRRQRPHVVHTHTAKAGLLGRVAARLAGVPIVVHTYHGHVLHGYFGPLRTALFRSLERALGRASDALVAVSQSVKDELVGLGVADAAKIRVVPLGLELTHLTGVLPRGGLRSPSGVSDRAPLVGIVGRLAPIKDVPTFLAAAAAVRRAVPEARFAVVGDGEEREALEAEARRRGLDGAVHFHGWQRDMAAVYGDLDVVVNCSRNEGTPVALIEALAAGRPVVATRVGGTPDLLARGEHGLLVPPGDAEALAAAIAGVLRSPESARARTARGRAYVLRQHTAERLVRDVDALYRQLLRRPAEAA
ncbi:MAG TPA: glycosyltransferase [Vicinamibacteria bacterium]|nr:glycosyltransferase [Vicinamibacteria bacterium]